jgi:hypothetical protein
MPVRALIALDYLATVLAAGLWVAAAIVLASSRSSPSAAGGGEVRRRRIGVALVFGAATATLLRVLIVAGLARAGWPYAQEKVVLALPLLVIPAALAVGVV